MTATAAALVAAGSVAAFLAPASASAAEARGRGADCVSYDDVTELVVAGGGTEDGVDVGDVAWYQSLLFDASGEQIGTVDADVRVVWQDPSNQHFYYWISETIELPDGTIRTAGVFDHDAVTYDGLTPYATAWGVSGDYAGKVGGRQFEIVQGPVNWATHIYLCGL
ncbi:allene oxide cyclase barrel-like domain-containing protein [Streptomyces litchfieldiae]|uniref:Allene oxide cyclase barrel-like domain-containing protein n=1 Tax=Streptomyces litchfieldiae TaxID=3075543 RepID=A0ABU2N0C4_9ACTN|nr:hypothetical protein [Streptomyces sp. DSM 44938]MDT0347329.1 hypothetical protein [Streptomyces sp. DSM 44938]